MTHRSVAAIAAGLLAIAPAKAQQVPNGKADVPVSARDRFYTSDQFSNTVSVIDPSNTRYTRFPRHSAGARKAWR